MAMESSDFKKWRKTLGLSQKDAAHLLGLKRRMIQYYEKGERDGDKVKIPRSVRLACYAIAQGVEDYNGPNRKVHMLDKSKLDKDKGEKDKPEKDKSEKDKADREKLVEKTA
jgi:transcriptional regulator with XRE-family HTH domain